jgi:hypothetical protein
LHHLFGLYQGNIAGSQWTTLSPPFSTKGIRCLTIEPGSLFIGTQGDGVLLYEFITPSVSRDGIPDRFSLEQNYPHPFNPTTQLEFGISTLGFVSLRVYDLSGRGVATLVDERRPAGRYTVTWDAGGFSAGVYCCRLTCGPFTVTKKMVLLR